MILQVAEWLTETWLKIWNMLANGGIIGLSIILFPILRKLTSFMKKFTN